MRLSWNWKRFTALALALVMVFASSAVIYQSSQGSLVTGLISVQKTSQTATAPVRKQQPSEPAVSKDAVSSGKVSVPVEEEDADPGYTVTLTEIEDTYAVSDIETPLANQKLAKSRVDIALNLLYIVMLVVSAVVLFWSFRSMYLHRRRIRDLQEYIEEEEEEP